MTTAIAAGSLALLAAAQPIERILADVDGRPVFLSEVRLVQRLRNVDRLTALEMSIDELLMYREALRFMPAEPSSAELETALDSLRKQASDALDVRESDWRRLARRQTTILKYVDLRLAPQIRIDADAVRSAFRDRYAQRADSPTFESVAEEIERQLRKSELDARIEAWIQTLRRNARVRYNEGALDDATGQFDGPR